MSTDTTTIAPAVTQDERVESPAAKAQRYTTGGLVTVIGLVLAGMAFTVHKSGTIALSDAFDEVQLPSIEVPGTATVLICALLVLASGIGILSGKLPKVWRTVAGLGIKRLPLLAAICCRRQLPVVFSKGFVFGPIHLPTGDQPLAGIHA